MSVGLGGPASGGPAAASAGPPIRLVAPRRAVARPLDPDEVQSEVLARRQGTGSAVIFGAPGTGKTSLLVEAAAVRVLRDGLPAQSVLALAPSRLAAARLRDQLSARIGGTVREPMARTPHSYAFGILRAARVLDGEPPPRLISGAEQDRVLAELLSGHDEGWADAPSWPPATSEQIRRLRGFRDELRELLMRAVERGLRPADLVALGRAQRRPDWIAAAAVLGEYIDVTALATPGAYDAAGIIDAAADRLRSDPGLLDAEYRARRLIVVDDAQELTVATQRLVVLLAEGGADVLVTGDPDAATQSFRGARPRAMADLADLLPGRAGRYRLPIAYRQPGELRAVTQRVAARIGSGGAVSHREARAGAGADAVAGAAGSGAAGSGAAVAAGPASRAEVRILASPAREGAFIAQYLRRHHLQDAVPWRRMAVVSRSARSTAALRRALTAAGVPVAVPPAQLPVRDEPAVVPVRLILRCALDPSEPTASTALDLLAGPIGGADAIALRRLRQALRADELAGGGGRGSDALIAEALQEPARLAALEPSVSGPARRVAAVIAAGRDAVIATDATPESVLWAIWTATGLDRSWQRMALAGGASGARADRDLDAVMALFEAAGRFTDRFPAAGPAGFLDYLEGQEIPMDTLAEQSPHDEAVALVTAQGAAGLEWDVVAVCGVQEGVWPDLRLRDSLLGAQRLADLVDGRTLATPEQGDSYLAARKAVLDDELRLFHVAVSRAARNLLVTAVRSDDELPSAFVDLVDPDGAIAEVRPLAEVPRTMTLPALVADLRSVLAEPEASSSRRSAAARQLAKLALAGVPGADPADWYGLAPWTGTGLLRAPERPVRVSPSTVESFDRCALRWLLQQSGGNASSTAAQGIGNLVHELANEVPDGAPDQLLELLEERFDRLGLGRGWVADSERARARKMVQKLAEYVALARAQGRELIATEQGVKVQVGRAEIRGMVDRLEQDSDGRLFIVDLKTGKSAPKESEVPHNPQLGVYQLAASEGGFATVAGGATETSGAALVQLGTTVKSVKVQPQPPLGQDPDPEWAANLVQAAAEGMAGEIFAARNNSMCRVCSVRRSCPMHLEGRSVGGST